MRLQKWQRPRIFSKGNQTIHLNAPLNSYIIRSGIVVKDSWIEEIKLIVQIEDVKSGSHRPVVQIEWVKSDRRNTYPNFFYLWGFYYNPDWFFKCLLLYKLQQILRSGPYSRICFEASTPFFSQLWLWFEGSYTWGQGFFSMRKKVTTHPDIAHPQAIPPHRFIACW